MTNKLLVFFFFIMSLYSNAQYKELVNKPYNERYKILNEQLELSKRVKSYDSIVAFSKKIRDLGKQYNDKALELEGDYYEAFYYLASEQFDEEKAVQKVEAVIAKAKKYQVLSLQIRATNILGYYFWNAHKKYERGFRYYIRTHELLQKTNDIDFPDWAGYYVTIANTYYAFKDYKTAIYYTKNIIDIPTTKTNWMYVWSALNNMGVYHMRLHQLDSAKYYYNKALESPFIRDGGLRQIITKGNIGQIHFLKKEYEEALPLLLKDHENAKKNKDYTLASSSAISISRIYLQQHQYKKANKFLDFIGKHLDKLENFSKMSDYYKVKSDYFFDTGNVRLGRVYNDSLVHAIKKENKKFNTILLLRAQQVENLNKIDIKNTEYAFMKKRYKSKIIMISIFSLFVLIAGLIIFMLIRRKHQIEKRIQQHEIVEANRVINNFKKHLKGQKEIDKSFKELTKNHEDISFIEKIYNEYSINDKDWEGFCQAINILYEGYVDRLKHTIPTITKSELRVALLIKMGLSNKDISIMLHVTSQAVRMSCYRLAKKVNITKDTSLTDFIKQI